MNIAPPIPVQPHPRPPRALVMHQRWRRLLFLHWAWDVAAVQATLPEGLTVDVWDEKAWLGIVPFRMEGVRPRFLPAVPWLSNFPELNVRTYVRDKLGRPGVWFYSLDCAQPVAVAVARAVFGLPYFHARMREQIGARSGTIYYDCQRSGDGAGAATHYEFRGQGVTALSGEGTIEQFLVERYRLFAVRGGRLLSGEVWHEPYLIQSAKVRKWSAAPLRQAGFDCGNRAPDHAVYAPGVDVGVFTPS